ncbi:MAG TPA: XRE family transcriptional regulator [Terriglobales bacterium]|nr:XRE family transcriptional regulator [Terriglobales bacterium]
MSKKQAATRSRSVFKDIGVPNAKEHLVKTQLASKIDSITKQRRLKQVETADLVGIRRPDVSELVRGEFRQFPVERLLRFLVWAPPSVHLQVYEQ